MFAAFSTYKSEASLDKVGWRVATILSAFSTVSSFSAAIDSHNFFPLPLSESDALTITKFSLCKYIVRTTTNFNKTLNLKFALLSAITTKYCYDKLCEPKKRKDE